MSRDLMSLFLEETNVGLFSSESKNVGGSGGRGHMYT